MISPFDARIDYDATSDCIENEPFPVPFFFIFVFSTFNSKYDHFKLCHHPGFEPRTSGIGSDRFAN